MLAVSKLVKIVNMRDFERHFENFFYDDYAEIENSWKHQLQEELAKAESNPEFDFFHEYTPAKPKLAVGEYVASQGFNVPLINSQEEWEQAFDEELAMIRSERYDDYAGMSGIISSKKLTAYNRLRAAGTNPDNFNNRFWDLVNEGLRSGELRPDDYMNMFVWREYVVRLQQTTSLARVPLSLAYGITTSRWRYVPGTNIRMFRDPNVEQKYYLGVTPDKGYVLGYQVEGEELQATIEQERADRLIVVTDLVDFYEQIRSLPLFDTTQAPLLEIQQANDGQLHFLQYFRTGHKVDYTEPFDLPEGETVIRASDVRGITSPKGEKMRLYISPSFYTPDMDQQGFYFEMIYHPEILKQYLCSVGKVAIHEVYISLKDNHFDSSPLIRPQVGMGLWDAESKDRVQYLKQVSRSRFHEHDSNAYINSVITSNGREATIQSDWELHIEK